MAARRIMRLAERQARFVQPTPRPPLRMGQWRVMQGLAPSTAGYGPLRDLPDWSFADGRPAPLWRGQLRRQRESRELALRAVSLSRSLEAAAQRGGEEPPPNAPPLRPKGNQYKPVRTSAERRGAGTEPLPGGFRGVLGR
ncbi:large ribosomal subunit protein mL52 [Athene noctua]|uniref:large ribosomal subunit protein mL52 n=1 Tax=Athene noctua TaxID=126797 RepID=UPI003EBAD52C